VLSFEGTRHVCQPIQLRPWPQWEGRGRAPHPTSHR